MNEPLINPHVPSAGAEGESHTPLSERMPASAHATPDDFEPLAAAHLTRARMAATLGALALALLASMLVAVSFGSVHVSLTRAFIRPHSPDHAILFAVRMPRVLMGAAVGAALAAVGAALQALVRNPLAEGGILGISGGGAFGAILALILLSARTAAVVPLCAFGAALLSTVMVYRLAVVDGRLEPFTLLLVGVIFNSIWGAAIMLVNSVVNFYYVHDIVFWLMGSLEAPTWGEVVTVAVMGTAGFALLMARARDLNLLSLGDEAAAELGVEVDPLRRLIFVATSVMIAAAVSVSGIISFVGLIVPHVLRLAFGADHRLLLPASFLGGAAFLVLADLVARVAIAPSELPVGAITALCGGPFFIYMLRRESRGPLAL
jgi:ABC-type Fe3+-siderophore transport system permease subunit